MHYVYAIGGPGGPYKIGHTAIPKARASGVRMHAAAADLQHLFWSFESKEAARAVERAAHVALAESRSHGEWFSVPLDEACRAVHDAARAIGAKLTAEPNALEPKERVARTGDKTKPLNLRVSPVDHALVAEMARKEGLPVATFIMWLLRKEAEKRGITPAQP
jgi:hypothetical protein